MPPPKRIEMGHFTGFLGRRNYPQSYYTRPGKAIGTHKQHTVDGALPELVPQAIEPGAIERGTTIAIVAEDLLTAQLLAFTFEMGSEPLDLLVDGVGQGLTVGRHADIDGCGHDTPPIGDEGTW